MIVLAQDAGSRHDLVSLCSTDSYEACRIGSLFESYGKHDSLARFWVGYEDNRPYCAVSLYGGAACIHLSSGRVTEELGAFIISLAPAAVICRQQLFPDNKNTEEASLMCHDPGDHPPVDTAVEIFRGYCDVPVKEIYSLLQHCRCDDLPTPEYDSFMPELLHLQSTGQPFCSLVRDKSGKAAAFAMVQYVTDKAAVIGAVCTLPQYRRMGLGRRCVGSLIASLGDRTLYITRLPGHNEKFYSFLGFENCGKTYIYKRRQETLL